MCQDIWSACWWVNNGTEAVCLALLQHGGTQMLSGSSSAVRACPVCPGPETHSVATQGLGAGLALIASTQQSTGHLKQRVGDYHSPEE